MKFYKYSGSGNDFIFLSELEGKISLSLEQIKRFCDRRMGVGADGVVLIGPSEDLDYSLQIFNSDGSEAEMCGNAARCSIHFAKNVLGFDRSEMQFETFNGVYEGKIMQGDEVQVKMTELYDVGAVDISDLGSKATLFLNTGVPHSVIEVGSVDEVKVKELGAVIRNDKRFKGGSNVNFFEIINAKEQHIKMRVYERGVEGETFCCGTGVIACAVTCARAYGWSGEIRVDTRGGNIKAIVEDDQKVLFFQGEVSLVFEGDINFG